MHILIAPNAFKHGPGATDVARALETGLKNSRLQCTTALFPVGDGGDGTAELIIDREEGSRVSIQSVDPFGKEIQTTFGIIHNGNTAVIEMANASGTRLLKRDELNPLKASSYGTGLLIKRALDNGVSKIIIGMGGSATVDGGTGILRALGIRFLNNKGEALTLPEELVQLHSIDDQDLDTRVAGCIIIVLCDVKNFLLGEQGAAAVFGPQKGAGPEAVKKLEAALGQFCLCTYSHTGKDIANLLHGGTAGGAAAGLFAYLNARLVDGATFFLEATGFAEAIQRADLLITGEGSLDEQTMQGKAPFAVAQAAKSRGKKVIGIAGQLPEKGLDTLHTCFDVLMSISQGPASLAASIENTEANLVRTGTTIGNLLALQS